MKKLALILVLVVVATGATLLIWRPWSDDGPTVDGEKGTYTVQRQNLVITLSERGALKARESTVIQAEVHSKIEWVVDEGSRVKKGDVLVRLERKEMEDRLDQIVNQITSGEAELKSAVTEEQIQHDQKKTDEEKAALALEVATVELRKLMESEIPLQERKLQLAIEQAEAAEKEADRQLKANAKLLQEEFVTDLDYEKAQLDLKKAQNDLQTAKMELKGYQTLTKPLEIKKKKAAVTEAERGLVRVKKKGDANLSAKQARVKQREVSLQRNKMHQTRIQEMLSKMTITAPTDGTVLYGHPDHWRSSEQIRVGQQVWHGFPIITLPDSTQLVAVIDVHEADIGKIKKGMAGHVASETQKGKIYDGEVVKIATVANAGRRHWDNSVKKFRVEIALKGKNLGLKPGTTCRVELRIDEVVGVLAVPIQAVHAREGKFFCYVARNGKPQRAAVTTGRSNDTLVEIKTGIEEGERVLLYDPEGVTEDDDEATGDGSEQKGAEKPQANGPKKPGKRPNGRKP